MKGVKQSWDYCMRNHIQISLVPKKKKKKKIPMRIEAKYWIYETSKYVKHFIFTQKCL